MSYQELINQILQLQEEGLEIFNVGKSTLGKNILATHVGNYNGNQIIVQAGIHSREWITSFLLIEQARYLHNNQLVTDGGIYFIFIINPDGVEIAMDGIDVVKCQLTKNYLVAANDGNLDFSQYKANINLVDLNTNFDANWGKGAQNVFCPATENFIGFYPNSEREVQNLIDITLKNKPLLTLSYHSKGNVIYYGFPGISAENLQRDKTIGETLSQITGYPLIFTENSTGGYKDWCINSLTIPAYTIEIGDENLQHPISIDNLPEIFQLNKDIPLVALNLANEYSKSIDFNYNILQNKEKEVKNESHAKNHTTRLQSLFQRRNSCWSHGCKRK